MKPRDRVLTALSFEQPDRPPFQASFTPEFAARLRQDLNLPSDLPHDPHSGRWNGYDLEIATHQDALQCSIGWVTHYYEDTKPYVDEWGVEWVIASYQTPFGSGTYTNVSKGPLASDEALETYHAPDPHRPALYENLARLIREYQDDYYIIGRLHTTIFETAWALRGLEPLMLDMIEDPDKAERILEIPYQYHRVVARQMAAMGVDMIWLGDDVGSQKYMMISPQMWRRFLKPRMATIIAEVKAINPRAKVAYHCDGNITPILPELIEIGVDVLNPVQPESMDPASIKQQFGKRLALFGAIDVQTTLAFGSSEQVRCEVRERMQSIGVGGGWICAPTHHIQLDTPMSSFWALVNAVGNPNDL